MFQHGLFVVVGQKLRRIALSGNLHNFKRHIGVQTFLNQINHNTVTGTDYFRDGTGAIFNQFLGISQPYIRTMRQSGYLQKVRKSLWLRVNEHLPDKIGSHFRQRQRTGVAGDFLLRHTQRFR